MSDHAIATDSASAFTAASPVTAIPGDQTQALDPGPALCLSGGGYRAMLFHLGAFWRLNELGYLPKLKRVSSVSGGSIAAGVLALAWKELAFDGSGVSPAAVFKAKVADRIHRIAGKTIDEGSILSGIALPGVSISDRIIAAYDKHLFDKKTLRDLPEEGERTPRFVFNASSVQSGALVRFSRDYVSDYRVGSIRKESALKKISIAETVTASSAFPPVLSPMVLDVDPADVEKRGGEDLHKEPYTSQLVLTDGGVYDNLGLETTWKRFKEVLVSDGGGKMSPESSPKRDWAQHSYRILGIVDNQVRNLRKRQLLDSYSAPATDRNHRSGAYWGIRSDIADFKLAGAMDAPHSKTIELANTKTRLKALERDLQERIVNWGYAVCDAAMRKHVAPTSATAAWPNPSVRV